VASPVLYRTTAKEHTVAGTRRQYIIYYKKTVLPILFLSYKEVGNGATGATCGQLKTIYYLREGLLGHDEVELIRGDLSILVGISPVDHFLELSI
jgi:hypothetical protein